MELLSTGNPDINNPVTMSVLEYLAKKGREAVSEKQTFGDKIRSMSDEEMAKFIESVRCYSHGWCEKCSSMNEDYCNGMKANEPDEGILEWLKHSVEDEHENRKRTMGNHEK